MSIRYAAYEGHQANKSTQAYSNITISTKGHDRMIRHGVAVLDLRLIPVTTH